MDIHKPKPWHGLREFLKEYVIIVVGVLTALGAEQAVEWLHWRHLAVEAERDLAAGVRPDLVNAYHIVVIESCGRARVAALSAALLKPGSDWRASPMPESAQARATYVMPRVYVNIGRVWSHAAWDAALGSGVLNHMPKDRVVRYGELYRLVDNLASMLRTESVAITHLAPLAYDRKLTEPEKAHYLEMVGEFDATTANATASARVILRDAHALGLDLTPGEAQQVLKRQHEARGDCVTDVKLPLERPAYLGGS